MKLLVINGSYRRGKTIDTLLDRATEGAHSASHTLKSDQVILTEKHIEYCRNCACCKNADPALPYAPCIVENDDMNGLVEKVQEADLFLFGSPVNIGTVTAVMKTFLERLFWRCAKPAESGIIKGVPVPRIERSRRAGIIVSTGLVPSFLRFKFDFATPVLRDVCKSSIGTKVTSTLYAAAIQKHGVQAYEQKAFALGAAVAN